MMQNRKLAREMKASRMGTKQEADGRVRGENRGGSEPGGGSTGWVPCPLMIGVNHDPPILENFFCLGTWYPNLIKIDSSASPHDRIKRHLSFDKEGYLLFCTKLLYLTGEFLKLYLKFLCDVRWTKEGGSLARSTLCVVPSLPFCNLSR